MKNLVFLFSALLLLASCSKSFKVNVESEIDKNGQKAYLTNYDTGDTIAIATYDGKKCTFEGTLEKPFIALITDDDCSYPLYPPFIVDEGETKVDKAPDDLKASGPLNEKMHELRGEALDKLISTQDATAFYNEYLRIYKENKDNLVGQWAFCEYINGQESKEAVIDELLKDAPAEYAQLKYIEKLKKLARQEELTAVGKMFVDFEIADSEGKTQKLSDYVGKGHNTLLFFFWPSTVTNDQNLLTLLNDSQKAFEAQKAQISIVGVPVYETPENAKSKIGSAGITFPVLIGNQVLKEPLELYGLNNVASYFVFFDKEGKIVGRGSTFTEALEMAAVNL